MKVDERNPFTLNNMGFAKEKEGELQQSLSYYSAAAATRLGVATLLLCRDISGLFYPFLGVRTAHHPASHDDRSESYEKISRYYCGQLAYLAGRLDAMPESSAATRVQTHLEYYPELRPFVEIASRP